MVGELNHQSLAWKHTASTIPPHFFRPFFLFCMEIYFAPFEGERNMLWKVNLEGSSRKPRRKSMPILSS